MGTGKYGLWAAVWVLLCHVVLVSCGTSSRKAEAGFVDFIGKYEREMSPLEESIQESRWRYAVSGSDQDLRKVDSLVQVRQRFLHNREIFDYLQKLRDLEKIRDPFLLRQLELLYRDFLPCQVSLSLQDSILKMELELKARTLDRMKDPEMRSADRVLRYSLDEDELKRAWLYVKQPGREMGRQYVELVKLRNRAARQLGFSDYFDLTLFLEEQEEEQLDSLFRVVEQGTERAYVLMRRSLDSALFPQKMRRGESLQPWHLRGRFFRFGQRAYAATRDNYYEYVSMESVVLRFFSGINLDLSDVFGRSLISGQSVYLPGLLCLDVDRRQDIRLIGHLAGTENDMQMLLAMAGEAAYHKYISQTLPFLLREPSSAVITCGIGDFFARMAAYPNWVFSMGVFSAGQAYELQSTTLEAMRQDQLFTSRWWLLIYHFEKQLYKNPDADLDILWRDLFVRYLKVEAGDERIGYSDWVVENYFSQYAVHAHNFLMGELWASQLLHHLCQNDSRLGNEGNPNIVGDGNVGTFLKRYVFQAGSSLSWEELTIDGTGSSLSASAFLGQFAE